MDEEFDFGMAEEEEGYRGSDQRNQPEPTEQEENKSKKARQLAEPRRVEMT